MDRGTTDPCEGIWCDCRRRRGGCGSVTEEVQSYLSRPLVCSTTQKVKFLIPARFVRERTQTFK